MKMLRLPLPALILAAAFAVQPAAAASFRWANDGDVATMDPDMLQETVQLSFLANIYEPLVRHDRDLKLEPSLATSWEQTSPTVWRFHLRSGVKWHDGSPSPPTTWCSPCIASSRPPRQCARRCRW